MSEAAGVGHNTGTLPLIERLELDYADHGIAVSEKLAQARALPANIEDDATNEAVAMVIKDLRDLARDGEDARKKEVEPHLQNQRDTNTFFRGFSTRLETAKSVLEGRMTKYLRAKAEAERVRREEAARVAAQEAERKLLEAQAAEAVGQVAVADFALDRAEQAERRAALAQEAAEERPAEMARTHFSGGISTLKTEWKFGVEDYATIDLNALRAFFSSAEIDKAIRGFVRSGGRQLAGVRIYENAKASVR